MAIPSYQFYFPECDTLDGLLGTVCAQKLEPVCNQATGQFWDDTACTSTEQAGCKLTPHSALLDSRSNCNVWKMALGIDAVKRWENRNRCIISITESVTQKCKFVCKHRWDAKNWKPRGGGHLDACSDWGRKCGMEDVRHDWSAGNCSVNCGLCGSGYDKPSKKGLPAKCDASYSQNKDLWVSEDAAQYCLDNTDFGWWDRDLGC